MCHSGSQKPLTAPFHIEISFTEYFKYILKNKYYKIDVCGSIN